MRVLAMLMVLVTAGCSDEPKEDIDVEEMNERALGPPVQISLEAIRYPDIEKNNLFGASCAFTPDGGGLGAVALAMQDGGYLKLSGEIRRFAPDAGSKQQPYDTRSKHTALDRSFELLIDTEQAGESGFETVNYPARLIVRDTQERAVYDRNGIAQCGA